MDAMDSESSDDRRFEPLIGTVLDGPRIELPDGRILDISGGHAPADAPSYDVHVLDTIQPFDFDACPICLGTDSTTAEHVPPASLGGKRSTLTCEACNNQFGPLEAALASHTRSSLRGPAFTGEGVQGSRRAREMRVVHQPDGSPVYLLLGGDEAIRDMLTYGGGFQMTYSVADRAIWRTALLKHAYLAACLYLRCIPDSRHAHHLRLELLSARDEGRRHEIGVFAEALRMLRSYGEHEVPPLYVATTRIDDGYPAMVGLGQSWLVAWPMPDTAPLLHRRLAARGL